jgi:hypothetical protein
MILVLIGIALIVSLKPWGWSEILDYIACGISLLTLVAIGAILFFTRNKKKENENGQDDQN